MTLYPAKTCDVSPRVRACLSERVAPFAERNFTGDVDAVLALARTGAFAASLFVDDRSLLGFRPDEITAALADKGVPAPGPPTPVGA